MRRSQASYLLTITALFLLLCGAIAGWLFHDWNAQVKPPALAWTLPVGLAVLMVGSAVWLHRFFRAYFIQLKDLHDDAQLILHTNPDRRATSQGPATLRALTATLNQFADELQRLQRDRDEGIRQARADLEEEHHLLAAIMAELTDSVIVCSADGRILLYNQQARYLLSPTYVQPEETDEQPLALPDSGFIGLGRSIFGLIDRNALTYGFSHLQSRSAQSTATAAAQIQSTSFVTAAANGALLRIRMAALTAQGGQLTGFVLTLQDMTQGITTSSRRDLLLQQLTERFRGGLANIRVAIESLEQFPTMPAVHAARLQHVIDAESTGLSRELEEIMREFADDLRAQWRHETVPASDLLRALQHHLATTVGLVVENSEPPADLWLRVDSYAIVHGMTTALRDLQQTFGVTQLHLSLQPHQLQRESATGKQRRFASLDVRWASDQVDVAAWLDWKERVSVVDAGDATLTLREVAERHGSEVWFQHDPSTAQSYFRLLVPQAPSRALPLAQSSKTQQPTAGSRPEYFDFDLFHQASQSPTLTERLLTELTYTVFDTETTGLDPTTDGIVAIGAVRIVNGRLLRQEIFEQLVDPRRPISAAAEAVHGIRDAMVRGQPTIKQAFPQFMRFVEETVLLGHNAAFDLRMFEVAEPVTGIKVTNPVLDTLLLSAVIHPDSDNHSLEAIAERLGIDVFGRHTALGDAFVTAEIFLRMIPLLKAQGIHTLGEAMSAAQKTYFARLQY